MVNNLAKNAKCLFNWLKMSLAVLIICTAILMLIGRQAIGSLDQYRENIQSFIASNTGMQIELGKLSGHWQGLVPALEVDSFRIRSADDKPVMGVIQSRAYLDVLRSIRHRALIWRELIIEDLAVSFVEDADGNWNLSGFTGQSESDLDLISKPFVHSRLIRLQSVAIHLQSFSGNTSTLSANEVLIENDADFHRAQLSLLFDKKDSSANLVLEAEGDFTDLDSLYAEGYLKFDQLNLSDQILSFAKSLAPELFTQLPISQLTTAGELWIDVHPGGGFDFEGRLSLSSMPLDWLADIPPITDIQTELMGWYTPGLNWGLRLQEFAFDWSNLEIEPQSMMFTQSLGFDQKDINLTISHLKLDLLATLMQQSNMVDPRLLEFLDKTDLRGNLSSLNVGKSDGVYQVSANVEKLNMHPHRGVPGMKEVDGYLEFNEGMGLFHISDRDGFELFFPKQYRDYQKFYGAEGTIYIDSKSVVDHLLVRSNAIVAKFPGGAGNIMFSVEQPRPANGQVPEFNLMISGQNLDASYGANLLPYKMPVALSSWLTSSIKGGNVNEFALLFRSGPPKNNKISRTTQLMFNVQNSTLKYHPKWPQIDNMSAVILIDDGSVSSQIVSANVGQTSVTQGTIEYDRSVAANERRLVVDSQVSSDIGDVIDVLASSPLKKNLGPLVQWEFSGQAHTQMHLEIPLFSSAQKPLSTDYTVITDIKDVDLLITGSPMEITNLSGVILFNSESGISSDNLYATLWQKPLTATAFREGKQQKISLNTSLDPTNLEKFIDFPWTAMISGDIPLKGTLDINGSEKPTVLELTSSMQGVDINLPKPLAKSAADMQPLMMRLYFEPSISRIEGSLGDLLRGDFSFANNQLEKGLLTYDREPLSPQVGQFLVAVHLPTTDMSAWTPLIDTVQVSQKDKNPPWQTAFDLSFDYLNLSGIKLQNIRADVTAMQESLDVKFTSDLASGQLSMPWDRQQVPTLELSQFKLDRVPTQPSSQDKTIDPRQFAPVNFAVEQLNIGNQSLGSLSFELRPEPSGAAFNRISGDLMGVQPGVFESQAPTEFFWGYDGNSHTSRLVGPLGVTNFADFTGVFALPKFLDSESGQLELNLSWQAEPWAISKETLRGDLKVTLEEGSFYRSSGGTEATLKIISLFNFANWLRRLQLDFSDVVGKNLAYNRLQAYLSFNQGVLALNNPLKIDMPSGKMSMAGEFNLIDETVDAKLVATLPIGVNLPWLVGLAGGLPAAAGVYITSKLAQKQVDRLSSISYTLNGSWDDIEVSVDEIFADELSNQTPSQ